MTANEYKTQKNLMIERAAKVVAHIKTSERVAKLIEWLEDNPENDVIPEAYDEQVEQFEAIWKWFNALELVESCMSMFEFTSMVSVKHSGEYKVIRAFDYKRIASVNDIDRCILIVPSWNEMYIIPESDYDKIPDVPDWSVDELNDEYEKEQERLCNEDLSMYDVLPGADQMNRESGL